MTEKEVTPLQFSESVIDLYFENKDHCTILEAMIEVCKKFDVPFESVCKFSRESSDEVLDLDGNTKIVKTKNTVNLVRPELMKIIENQCENLGLLK